MKTARLLVAVALSVVTGVACESSKEAERSGPTVPQIHPASAKASKTTRATTTEFGVTAEYIGPITHDDSDPATGISLTVPPADAKPTLSWQQAVTRCFSGAGICNRAAGGITVSLAVGYNPQSGNALADGSIKLIMNHDLVYVLAQRLGPCAPVGVAGIGARSSTHSSCTALSFVDAHTGKGAAAVSGPSIRDPATG